jgi:hypothetical protein
MQDDTDMVRLAPLIGEWSVEATFPSATPQPLGQSSPAGRATFEWTLGGQFLQQSVEIPHPEAPDSLAIIGYDPITGAYTQHYFDSRGVARVYAMGFEDGVWSLLREAPDFTPLHFAQRFTGKLSADGRSIAGRWETGDGQTWSHDFDLVYTKVG